ncbi:MAG: MCE family protein [Lentisphaeria bacterium]|nr:MCE family protein [Lentisphaeria bacterium]
MAQNSNFRIGLFVLSALVLAGALLYFLGMSDLFRRKAELSAYFSESVQGLAEGAQIKYKGAQIGTVDRIVILPQRKIIQVNMSVELDSFRDHNGEALFPDDDSFFRFLEQEIRAGLRCRLELAGITGLRYLEFDYFAPPGEVELPMRSDGGFVMPSAPSALRDVVKSLNTSLERISKIQFEAISDKLVGNLNDLNKILASEDVRNSLSHLNSMAVSMDKTAAVLSQVITEERLRQLVDDLESSLADAKALTAALRKDAEKSDLAGTAASVRKAADAVTNVVQDQSPEVRAAVDAWIRALDAFRELMDTLNQDPSAVIRGKR